MDSQIGNTPTVRAHFQQEDGSDLDISGATTLEIILNDEVGGFQLYDLGTSPAVVFDNENGNGTGTDGRAKVNLPTTALTLKSVYRVQGYSVTPAGTFSTEIKRFRADENLIKA